jgi:hypothetical protein
VVRRQLAALALLALALSLGQGQERRRALSALSMAGGEVEAWAESLDAALASSARLGEVRRASPGGDAIEEAARLGFDLAVIVSVEGSGAASSLSWAVYLAYAPPPPEGPRRPAATGLVRSLPSMEAAPPPTLWLGLLLAADRLLSESPAAGTARLRVVAPPGTRIRGLSKEPALVPDSGFLELRLRSPSSYVWLASLSGHEDETGLLSVAGTEESLSISLRERRPASLETGLLRGAFPDFWFSWRLAEGRLFARAGLVQYLAGLSLKNEESSTGKRPYIEYLGRFEPALGLGCYLTPPDEAARLYLALDSGLRISVTEDDKVLSIARDELAPIELRPAFGLEWRASPLFNLFFELGSSLYPTGNAALLESELEPEDEHGDWPHATGDYLVAEFFILRFGVRFAL